ncbi:MAG: glucans biosynthesis glucosyltransferase MdoH [Pseudomonadota bacterium]
MSEFRPADESVIDEAVTALQIDQTAEKTHADDPIVIRRRRLLILLLNIVTCSVLFGAMAILLSHGGLVGIELVMLLAYGVTLPWLSIGLWNSLIGFVLDRVHGENAASRVTPALARISDHHPIKARVAIVMPLRNEDPHASLERLRGLQSELARTPWARQFDFHVLSDSDQPEIAMHEETVMAKWRRAVPGAPVSYRRRETNTGYKAGNIAEFVQRCGEGYDYFLPLDADSVMGAQTVLRLVRVMQVSPEIGLLQSLVTGLPSRTFFTRAFQFGMRHGMRSYTLGATWWQADCGPNWGHNAVIRMLPFRDHCMLPALPGRGPLSGDILSHDQLEAALLRRAGYQVRVLAEESDSHEENPPSLTDFIRRELRWCNGNMQYLRLLGMEGLKPVSRIQLYLAIQMYLAAPAWILFIGLGAALAGLPGQIEGIPVGPGLTLFAVLMTLNLMPKLMGLGQVLAEEERAAEYGGRRRVVVSGFCEILFSMLTAPIVAFALTVFLVGLVFGSRVGWDAQQRTRVRLYWAEAARVLWPQTLGGIALAIWLGVHAPWTVFFAAPMLLSFVFAIPLAVLTTLPTLSRWSMRLGVFDIPEDRWRDVHDGASDLQADVA